MKTSRIFFLVPVLVVVLLFQPLAVAKATAQAQEAPIAPVVRTTSLILNNTGAQDIAQPTSGTCPTKKTCTAVVVASMTLSSLSPADQNDVVVGLYVDGSLYDAAGICSNSCGSSYNEVRTKVWVIKNLKPGQHTFQVYSDVLQGTAGSANATLSGDMEY